jgi:hypothetical protein
MLNIVIPKEHYNRTTYPALEERADGALVPIAIGDIDNIIPVCIDTVGQVYEICGHAIHAVTQVRTPEGIILVAPGDYSLNAGKNRISLLATPFLAASTTYWFVVEPTYTSGPGNFLRLHLKNGYAGSLYTISVGGTWTIDPASHDIRFRIYGKETLGGTETLMVNNGYAPRTSQIGLGDIAARTRIGQRFTTSAKSFYVTRIQLFSLKTGLPTGTIDVTILSSFGPPEVPVGIKGNDTDVGPRQWIGPGSVTFPQRATDSGLIVDIEGAESIGSPGNPIADGADAIQYLVETVLDKSPSLLNSVYLADLKTDRTQEIKIWLDKDTTFGKVVGKLESSLLFKLIPLLDGTYGAVVYETGEDSNTPHFVDEDYLSFSLRYDWTALKYKIIVKYDEDAGGQMGFKVEEASSDIARFFYESEETLEVETFLHNSPSMMGATWLAGELSSMYEYPPIIAEFEVHGWGLDLIPGRDKVSITRARAGYTGARFIDELFRVIKLVKRPGTSTVVITAQLDAQTY